MPTSKHWVIPNTIPCGNLKTLYSSATSAKCPYTYKQRDGLKQTASLLI